ncbi:MAG: FAD-binding oxidoreductase [Sphingomonas sp.]|uniref:NAD(P)/FAD-dependent oxidoreductase n=1 Tax=Sphingomonas sp. TaxID=28214 RepID=UPI0025E23203|nr:FAD-binding oxidoreductase [Sphingomonas sp.]MBX3566237.1 FAD-binding oxidoreductase [Sphingomonas sp.]
MKYDVAIVGGGIAGASLAAEVAPHARVVVLEAEARAGYHSTGRSAAFWSESYGGPDIQPLTTASGPLLRDYLDPMGSLHIGRTDEGAAIDAFLKEFEGSGVELKAVDPHLMIPGLRAEWTLGVHEPSCEYIDVGRLHDDYLKAVKRAGGEITLSAGLVSAVHDGHWRIETRSGALAADILVNAAGAWADPVASACGVVPLGIQPYRRTIMQLKTDPAPPEGSPMIAHIGGSFYWKPEAGGRIWLSPHDEIACDPCDSQPEDIDVAIAIDRFEHVVDWRVEKLEHKWAGLRSFARDRLPVYGFDLAAPGFFWCVGQGGFGIQTAPAAARLAAAILLGQPADASVAGVDPGRYSPARFKR